MNPNFNAVAAACTTAIGLFLVSPVGLAQTINATTMSQAGNGGYSVVTQFGGASEDGAYIVAPLSGTGFLDNSTQGAYSISSRGGPLQTPTLTASATGYDDGTLAADGAFTSIAIDYTYNFAVTGPATDVAVPLEFFVATSGSTSYSGNAASRKDSVGTSIRVTSPLVSATFQPAGSGTGTAPGIYSSGQYVLIGWGSSSPYSANYDSYSASDSFAFTVLSGALQSGVQTFKISTSLIGGTTGTTAAPGVVSTGSVASMIDPYLVIDPVWLQAHPGYSVAVDAGVGNGVVAAVPEPSSWLLFAFAPIVAWVGRRRGRKEFRRLSAAA